MVALRAAASIAPIAARLRGTPPAGDLFSFTSPSSTALFAAVATLVGAASGSYRRSCDVSAIAVSYAFPEARKLSRR